MSLRRRDLVDEGELRGVLADAAADKDRAEISGILRAAFDRGFDLIRAQFESGGINGARQAELQAFLVDRLIRCLYDLIAERIHPVANPTEAERLTVVATGGYGRGELSPKSDIDLLLLHPLKRTGWCEQVAEYLLYALWDSGLKVGQAVRTPGDCVRQALGDLTIRTNLLETRLLAGDARLYQSFVQAYEQEVLYGTGPVFVEQKLAERDKRHKRFGDSRYVVEPHLKDGKGGLRDLHTLVWIARYLYRIDHPKGLVEEGILSPREFLQFRRAYGFMMSVRAQLHYLTGRAEDRLTFDVQPELAQALGYAGKGGLSGVERFMKHYFLQAKAVGDLTRVVCAVLEQRADKPPLFSLNRLTPRRSVDGFRVDNDRLTFRPREDLATEPERMIEIFAVAQREGLDIHPEALRLIKANLGAIGPKLRQDRRANADFMAVLTDPAHPEINLTRMNEAGVFGRFVPDFGRVVAMMQFDMYHHYTVDAHTIRAVGLLAAIERGELEEDHPLATAVFPDLISRRALYVAVLLHDIAKGRKGDHSVLGAEVARKLGPRLGLADWETQLVAWLVRWHLLMSHYAFKRDLADPKTLEEFVRAVGSVDRLRMLLVLTVVDIRAVGPDSWNAWKAQLLRDLFQAAADQLRIGHAGQARAERIAARKAALVDALGSDFCDGQKCDLPWFLTRMSDSYWIGVDPDTILSNAHLVFSVENEGRPYGVAIDPEPQLDVVRVAVYAQDRPGLFAALAGALAGAGVSVGDAKIDTSADGWALDNFSVQSIDGTAFTDPDRLDRLQAVLTGTLEGRHKPGEAIDRRGIGDRRLKRALLFQVTPAVFVDLDVSAESTVIEINARDRVGLLYDLACAISELKLLVYSAHVTTFGERAVDTFYVRDRLGRKITAPARLKAIETRLLAAARRRDQAQAA